MNERDWDDPQYKAWRLAVYKRDNFCCQFPGCKNKGKGAKLQAHHIKRWADAPELRFILTNGVTLCKMCHKKIGGQEQNYESLFLNIALKKNARTPKEKQGNDDYWEAKRILYGTDDVVDED